MKIFIILALLTLLGGTSGGPLAYGLCQTGCNTVWVACCAAAGATAGVVTGGAGAIPAVLACNVAQGACMAICAAILLTPTI
jgi:hypothetical protein